MKRFNPLRWPLSVAALGLRESVPCHRGAAPMPPPRRPREAVAGDGAQRRPSCLPGGVRLKNWHTTARRVRDPCKGGSRARPRPRIPCPVPMTARADLLAVIRAYMAHDDAAGLAEDLLLTLDLDQDQEDALSDLRNELKTAPK